MNRLLLTPVLAAVAAVLVGCTAPINIHSGVDPQVAGRCELVAYSEDRAYFATGLPSLLIAAGNSNARRQAIFEACVAAGGQS
jgi:hypothetical protein